jgi:hypothetical protein
MRVESGEGYVSHPTICGLTIITPSGVSRVNVSQVFKGMKDFSRDLEKEKDFIALTLSWESQSS